MDRRAVADADVDPLVHAPPAPAERARDRAGDRPDQAGRRRRRGRTRCCRLRGADLRGERGARRLQRVDLARPSARSSARELREGDELLLLRRRERSFRAPTSASRVSRAWASRARRSRASRRAPCAGAPSSACAPPSPCSFAYATSCGDLPVLAADRRSGSRPGRAPPGSMRAPSTKSSVDGVLGLVDRRRAAGSRRSTAAGTAACRNVEPVGLEREELVQLRRAAAGGATRSLLERLQPERDVADLRLERADPARDAGDLARSAASRLLLRRERCLQRRDLRVDLLLLRGVVAERRRRERRAAASRRRARLDASTDAFAARGGYSCGVQRLQRLGGRLPERADERAVVVVADLARAVVELELLERRERAVALLDRARAAAPRPRSARRAVVVARPARAGTAARRAGRRPPRAATPSSQREPVMPGRVRAVRTSRRCSRASGHSATAEPTRKTMPAIQIRFTSGLTSTLKKTRVRA